MFAKAWSCECPIIVVRIDRCLADEDAIIPDICTKEKTMTKPEEVQRVYWHSRRGMLEIDLALMPFAEHQYALLPKDEQETYVRLLTSEDTDLFAWILQRRKPEDAKLAAIMEKIITYAKQGKDTI